MFEFDVQAISCGHCVKAVNEAIKEIDPAASVDVQLDSKKVKVESVAGRQALVEALTEAGYPPAD
jgi:copper chaperone